MNEQEYIYVRDLSNVLVMRQCLDDLNLGHSVMSEEEHKQVKKILSRWKDGLFEKITPLEKPPPP